MIAVLLSVAWQFKLYYTQTAAPPQMVVQWQVLLPLAASKALWCENLYHPQDRVITLFTWNMCSLPTVWPLQKLCPWLRVTEHVYVCALLLLLLQHNIAPLAKGQVRCSLIWWSTQITFDWIHLFICPRMSWNITCTYMFILTAYLHIHTCRLQTQFCKFVHTLRSIRDRQMLSGKFSFLLSNMVDFLIHIV